MLFPGSGKSILFLIFKILDLITCFSLCCEFPYSPSLHRASLLKSWVTVLLLNSQDLFWLKGQEDPLCSSSISSSFYSRDNEVSDSLYKVSQLRVSRVQTMFKILHPDNLLPIPQYCHLIFFSHVLLLTVSWPCILFLLKIVHLFKSKDHSLNVA